MSSETERVLERVKRADAHIGEAIRAWMASECARLDFDFAGTALALHSVVSTAAVDMAVSACPPHRLGELREWYLELVLICIDTRFEEATKNGGKIA